MTCRQTRSPKWFRTSAATCSAGFVRASYVTSTNALISSPGFQTLAHQFHVGRELAESFEGVELALDGDHHFAGGGEGVDRRADPARAGSRSGCSHNRPGSSRSPCGDGVRAEGGNQARSRRRQGPDWLVQRRDSGPSSSTQSSRGRSRSSTSYMVFSRLLMSNPRPVEALPCGSRSITRVR